MKKIFLLILLVGNSLLFAQDYDTQLEKMAGAFARKLNQKGAMNVAVYPFYNPKHRHTNMSRMISEDFTVYLNQHNTRFKIIERTYLEQMMEEHHLNEDGLIDPTTAKKFGMIIAADAYITGRAMLVGTAIRLSVFAIDTETGERIYSDFKRIPLDQEMADFLGIKDFRTRQQKQDMYRSSNPDCARLKVGDFCFVNKTGVTRNIQIFPNTRHTYVYNAETISLRNNERKCFKDLKANASYKYVATKNQTFIGDINPKGIFRVKTCKSNYVVLH